MGVRLPGGSAILWGEGERNGRVCSSVASGRDRSGDQMAGALLERDRKCGGVVRLLPLRDDGGDHFRSPLLSQHRSGRQPHALLRIIRPGLRGPAHRRHHIQPHRRPYRSEEDADRDALAHGRGTGLMGLLPHHRSIGVWAPILLTTLRLIQGLALGGEWGGGLLLAVEYAPRDKRGLYGAVPQTGALFGLALGSFAASVSTAVFSDQEFRTVGWRIPFLLSVVLIATGLWIRTRVGETPSFVKVKSAGAAARVPIADTLRYHWRAVLVTIGSKFVETATFFIFATFTISYAVGTLG